MISTSVMLLSGMVGMAGLTAYALRGTKHSVDYVEEYYNELFTGLGISKGEHIDYEGTHNIGRSEVIQFKLPITLTTLDFEAKRQQLAEKLGCKSVSISTQKGIMSIRKIEEVGEVPPYMWEKTESYIVPVGYDGDLVDWNIRKDSHLLVAGASNSGKSTLLNMIICHLIQNEGCKLWLIDLKQGAEFTCYRNVGCVERFAKDITDAEEAIADLIAESVKRFEFLVANGHRNYWNYVQAVGKKGDKLDLKVVVIDEVADILALGGKEAIANLVELARKCRAVGISLVMATQKPTADAIPTAVTTNVTGRICFRVANGTASKVALDYTGAEKLGDYECLATLTGREMYFKSFNVTDQYIDGVCKRYSVEREIPATAQKGGVK